MLPSPDPSLPDHLRPYGDFVRQLQSYGEIGWKRGWNLATSGSLSVVVRRDPTELLITDTNAVKRNLCPEDLVLIDSGRPQNNTESPQSVSAAHWHWLIAIHTSAGAIMQTYSVWTTILAARFAPLGGVLLDGYEMLKVVESGITPDHMEWLPILSDSDDTVALETQIQRVLQSSPSPRALLLSQYGLLTWGKSLEDTYKKVEAFEFLCEVIVRQSQLG